eukprot:115958_1
MAQIESKALSLLKISGKGWNNKIFEDEAKISGCLCANCNAICCDAVELGCEKQHNDNDIYLYCNQCLTDLINDNNTKCPINLHDNPNIIPTRAVRRQVYNSIVLCPFSFKYKSKQNGFTNAKIIDTLVNNENEGSNFQQNINLKCDCNWKGTLSDLISTHIAKCFENNDTSYTLDLKNENKKLHAMIDDLQCKLNKKQLIIDELKNQLIKAKNAELNFEFKEEYYNMNESNITNNMKFIVPVDQEYFQIIDNK